MPSARAIVPLTFALAAVGGCGERREAGGTVRTTPVTVAAPAPATAAAVATVEVSLEDYRLVPGSPRVARHGVIGFVATNDGQNRHALAVDGPTGERRSLPLRPGERATISLLLPRGTYKWYCPIADHEARGMTGLVRVAE
jgi:plastocyanin